MKLIKHIGKLKDLDTKVLVIFMQLPDDKKKALVVATHTLPDLIQDEIMRLVETDEGQKENTLGTFLSRKTLSNGNGVSILQWLHQSGKMVAVPTDAVIMTPHPGYPTPLTQVLELMAENSALSNPEQKSLVTAETDEDKKAVAENLLIEAKMLREEADKKEATALELAGSVGKKVKSSSKKKKEEGSEGTN
jgi:uncharacterized protein YheU (UPF0270 family)